MIALEVLALAALSPLAAHASPAPAPVVGPPAICHPLDIGAAASLPWRGRGSFTVDPGYAAETLTGDTLALLDSSADPLVHMETLRRATIYATGVGGGTSRDDDWHRAQSYGLLASLRGRVLELEFAPTASRADGRRRALAWLDLGYLEGALGQVGQHIGVDGGDPRAALDCALTALELGAEVEQQVDERLEEERGAFELAWVLAAWEPAQGSATWRAHLAQSLALAQDGASRLGASQVSTLGSLLGCSNHAELVQRFGRREPGATAAAGTR